MDRWKLIRRRLGLVRCWLEDQVVAPLQYYGVGSRPRQYCPIDWRPNALAPVFYGVRDYGLADGAPGPCRVFFPSLDGSPQSADVLDGCGPYPLILFAHGQCELDTEHYRKWFELPATLARAGYVVVVPEIPHVSRPQHNEDGMKRIGKTVRWMRTCWRHRNVLHRSTGVAGHSYGAILAARFAAQNDVSAYAGVSGSWQEFPGSVEPLVGVEMPTFFCWGVRGFDVHSHLTEGEWNSLARPKHKATFEGANHWDFLPADRTSCDVFRGPCSLTHWLTMDLLAMFFGRYLTRQDSPTPGDIPASLLPPDLNLSSQQEFFSGAYLQGFSLLENDADCEATVTWEADGETGSTTVPQ